MGQEEVARRCLQSAVVGYSAGIGCSAAVADICYISSNVCHALSALPFEPRLFACVFVAVCVRI